MQQNGQLMRQAKHSTSNDAAAARAPVRRPALITLVCLVGALSVLLSAVTAFSGIERFAGRSYPLYLLVSTAVQAVSLFGMWKLRRWGVYLYTVLTVGCQAYLFVIGGWALLTVIAPLIVLGIGYSYLRRMT